MKPRKNYWKDGDGKISVYKITNLVNGNLYIGVTGQRLKSRAAVHRHCALTRKTRTKIARAIRKYGFDMFVFSTLARLDTYGEAYALERRLIAAWHPRYNITKGGGQDYDEYWTDKRREQWARQRAALPPRKFNGYCAEAIESYRRAGRRNMGRWMSIRHKGVEARKRRVVCLNDGIEYESGSEAARAYGLERTDVIRVCSPNNKYRKSAHGFRFAYADTQEKQ